MATPDPEVPEADALEQSQPVVLEPTDDRAILRTISVPLEADEADVLDQAREVPDAEDDWR